jgi:nitrite reductase/ring-hydroxylating ferredoxin subunit
VSSSLDGEWLVVGANTEFARVGDFRGRRLGNRAVIVVRASAASFVVLENVCPHEHLPVVGLHQAGNTRVFVCPYHAWSFTARDGRYLPGIGPDRAPGAKRDLERFRATSRGGIVWATVGATDPEPPDHTIDFGVASPPSLRRVPRSWRIIVDELRHRPGAIAVATNAVLVPTTVASAERVLVTVSPCEDGSEIVAWTDLGTACDDSSHTLIVRRRRVVDDVSSECGEPAPQVGGGASPT